MEIGKIAKLLDDIAPMASNWHGVGTMLRKQGLETSEHPLWKYVFAFEYMYVEKSNQEQFERYGPFAPWIETQEGVFPPPITVISDEILSEWKEVCTQAAHPIICARLADLLWTRRWGDRVDIFARKAIDSYLAISKIEWVELERAYCLSRALDISKDIRDNERKALVVSAIIEACRAELKSDALKPGVSLRLIEALMSLKKNEIPSEVDEFLELSMKIYSNNDWVVESIFELMTKRASSPEKQRELHLSQITKWIEAGDREKGIIRLHHWQHALELARNNGFQNIVVELLKKMQVISDDDMGMQTLSTTVEIPSSDVERHLDSFIDERGWRESFARFGIYGPPSGNYQDNLQEIEQRVRDFPFQFLVSRAVYDDNNVPIRFGRNLDENKAIALIEHENMGIMILGTFAPRILDRIKQKHGVPTQQDAVEFFTTSIIPKDIAENIAQAIHWYYQGEFDVAAHILVPRIEAVFRVLSRELGLPIMKEPIGDKPGGVISLGSLLTGLTNRIDESWQRYFFNLLANPIGVNLRNRICHGLLNKAGKNEAALLIHAICNLRLLEIDRPSENKQPAE